MKKFLVLLSLLFSSFTYADTETINWWKDGTLYDTTTCTTGGDITLPIAPTKYGYTFQGWKKAYTEVEYLQSSGTQWIDTGFIPNQNSSVKTKAKFNTTTNSDSVFGTYYNTGNNGQRWFSMFIWNNEVYFVSGDTNNQRRARVYAGDTFIVDWDKLTVKYIKNDNPETTVTFQSYDSSFPNTISLFSGNVTIYYYKLYDNNILVRDFIPVLDYNNIPCMFDKVTRQFYYNQGTGDFIAGPIINQ